MKKLITVLLAITLLAVPCVLIAQDAPQPQPQDNALRLQQMELRALIAEIQNLRQAINDKVARANELQAQIQAAQAKALKESQGDKGKK